MTRPFLSPGCWGSVLCAQAATTTCAACPYKDGCFEQAVRVEADVVASVQSKLRIRNVEADDISLAHRKLSKYLAARKQIKAAPKPKSGKPGRTAMIKGIIERLGIDVQVIKTGVNPFGAETQPLWHRATQFILEGVPFKLKDVVIEVGPIDGLSANSLKTEVSRFLTVLADANVLERKERKILCLQR